MKIKIKNSLSNKGIKAKLKHKELFFIKEALGTYSKKLDDKDEKKYIEYINQHLFDSDEYENIKNVKKDIKKMIKEINNKLNKVYAY